jgi:serine protease
MGDDHIDLLDRRAFLAATGAAGGAVALGGVASGETGSPDGRELLVGVSAGTTVADVESGLPTDADVVERNPGLGYLKVRLPATSGTYGRLRTEARVSGLSGVRYVEAEATYELHETPSDTRLEDQYAPQQVGAPEAWGTTFGSDDVTIAVVDQGVKYDHPDLRDRFGENKGRDFVGDDDDPMPEDREREYHGTHVAGIASATTDNDEGVAGVSNSRLLSCRVFGAQSGGRASTIADALEYAADQGADVVNMSLGGGGFSETVKQAVSYATNEGALIFASAGNSGEEGVSYPAAYDETVAVSAVGEDERLADFSQYGETVDVTGPGVDVLSCWTASGQPYRAISGTSMSCPAAAGVAALGKAADPDLGVEQLRQRVTETAVDVGLPEAEQGAGRVDAASIVDPGDGGDGGDGGNGGDGGSCGDATAEESIQASVDGPDDGFTTTYATRTEGTCRLDVSLDSDVDDLDLYATLDGRTPTTDDYDERSYEIGSDESLSLAEPGEEVGLLVDAYSGQGSFTLDLAETGRREGDGGADGGDGGGGRDGGDDGDGSCARRETTAKSGRLSGDDESREFAYTPKTDDPCRVVVVLEGPADADFDLFLNLDGTTPTRYDSDRESTTQNSNERIRVEDVSASDELAVSVGAWSGSGEFDLRVEEFGR